MSKQRKIHLFNCDHTYKLDAVEDWINTAKSKRELELILTTKRYFSLSQMTELSSKNIPELDMDVAVFVIHAHESRLSINEENAGIGYAMIYRALLQKTGGKVIIVIGGDDGYKDEDEEDKEYISRWARRKISSQFSEEFMDGRKSFIFSWDKKHREIHEKALLHFLDPSKKGLKFEYQPPTKRKLPPKPTTPPPVRPLEPEASSRPYSSLPAEGPYTGERVQSTKLVVPVERKTHPATGDQGTRLKENRSSSTVTTKQLKELAILGCSVLERSIDAVKRIFEEIRPNLNFKADPPVENLSPVEVKQYLEENSLRFCVLMVDAETVKDAYDNLPERKKEYEILLKTAVDKVAEKVVILVYDNLPLKPQDEAIVHQTIDRIVKEGNKGFIAWLKNGNLTVDSDVLAQFLTSESNTAQKMPQSGSEGFHGQTNVPFDATTELRQAASEEQTRGYHVMQPSGSDDFPQHFQQPQCSRTIQQSYVSKHTGPSSGERVMLKSKLYKGKISFQKSDREILTPGFVVPAYVCDELFQQYCNIPEAEVKIVADSQTGAVRWIVNSVLMLKTRVRYGLVSMEPDDLVYICPNWNVPPYIAKSLYGHFSATPKGKLYVFSDEEGRLKYKVDVGLGNRLRGFANENLPF